MAFLPWHYFTLNKEWGLVGGNFGPKTHWTFRTTQSDFDLHETTALLAG